MANRAQIEKLRLECDAAISALPKVKKTASGFTFLCFDHADENPSCDWNTEAGVFVCRVCSKGGGTLQMAERLKLAVPETRKREDFGAVSESEVEQRHGALLSNPDALAWLWTERRISSDTTKKFKIGLVYFGVDKSQFFYPIRTSEGWFPAARHYRPHEVKDKKRIWLPSFAKAAPGVKINSPLWGGFEASNADVMRVLVFEGEDKALAADSLSIPNAACVSTTAGCGKWDARWGGAIRGKNVAYFPDLDAPGLEAVPKVAAWARAAGCASFRVVKLSGLDGSKKSKDLTDWLRAGNGVDKLMEEIGEAEIVYVAPTIAPDAPETPNVRPDVGSVGRTALTELGNAERLARIRPGDFRWCEKMSSFLAWNSRLWDFESEDAIGAAAREVIADLYAEGKAKIQEAEENADNAEELTAIGEATLAWAKASEASSKLSGSLAWLRTQPGISVKSDQLDADKMMVNCLNGTLDLEAMSFRRHRREDLMTKTLNAEYIENADTSRLDKFLLASMGGDLEKVQYLQRCIGHSLSGDCSTRCIWILHGMGANGKSTFINAMLAMFGSYGKMTPAGLLEQKKDKNSGAATPELVALRGVRFAPAVETEDGHRLAESLVKHMTGDDSSMSARGLFQDQIEFEPQFHIFLATNHLPTVRGNDAAIWDRIQKIPWNIRFWNPKKKETGTPELMQDHGLKKYFKSAEGRNAVLSWAVKGASGYAKIGLNPPKEVVESTAEYKADMDSGTDWISERTETWAGVTSIHDLFVDYIAWAKSSRTASMSKNAFGRKLTEAGFEDGKTNIGARGRKGIRLKSGSSYVDKRYEKEPQVTFSEEQDF